MSELCTIKLIQAAQDQCGYVIENCKNQDIIQFTEIYFCQLNQNWIILLIFLVTITFVYQQPIFIFVMFQFLSMTADQHLAPAVARIAEYLNMSQTLAGVTVIAFCNGAADVLAAIIAAGGDDGILIAVGSIFGSGLIMTSLGLGLVIYLSKVINANRRSLNRDITFILIGICATVTFAYIGYVNYIMAALFICIYFIYILVVLHNENQDKKEAKASEDIQKPKEEENAGLIQDDQMVDQIKKEVQSELIQKEDSSILWKGYYYYDLPLHYIRLLTIPACKESEYNKLYTIIHCVICPPFMLWQLRALDSQLFQIEWIYILYFYSFIILICVILNKVPFLALVITSAACSVIWCKSLVEVLVDFLMLLQVLTGLSYTYLGMTLLAFGNSTCDLIVNMKLARMGLGLMGFTASFSGLIFNLFIGFGLALVRKTWFMQNRGFITFDLFRDPSNIDSKYELMLIRMNNSIAYCVLFYFFINIIMTIAIVKIINYKFKENIAKYYIIFYIIFFLMITAISLALNQAIDFLQNQ